MASTKVVKLEDVGRFPDSNESSHLVSSLEKSTANQTALSDLLAYGTVSSLLLGKQDELFVHEHVDEDADAEEEEKRDKVPSLPNSWPKLPEIFRRRSCEMTQSTASCVNKAVSHLELLQSVVEEWSREKETERRSRQSTTQEVRKDVRFSESRASTSMSKGSHSATSRKPSLPSSGLAVQGVGFKEDVREQIIAETNLMPFLGAEEVIEEVMTLLARLENDRQETEKAIEREGERVTKLTNKIDTLCRERMLTLPAMVQKEHEECIVDLTELQWHVAYGTRNEIRLKERWNIAQVLNTRLKEDIEFVKKHIPLVEEKLDLEGETMDKIWRAQNETDQELDLTKNRYEKTEAKSNEALQKAELERGHMKSDLDKVRDALNIINDELSHVKMTFNGYIHQINDVTQQLIDNEQELKVLEVKNENAKAAEEIQAAKVKDLEVKIVEAEFEHNRLEAENAKLHTNLGSKRDLYVSRINELELAIRTLDNTLREVDLRNQETIMEVQDFNEKKADCMKQKLQDERNIKRIVTEIQKLKLQLDVTLEELDRVTTLNISIKNQLTADQEKTSRLETSLKVTLDAVKEQLKDEQNMKTTLSTSISTVAQDLEKSKVELGEKRSKAVKVVEDVVAAVSQVKEKVEKLRVSKEVTTKKKVDLSKQFAETKKQREESEKKFQERISHLQPHHNRLKEQLLNINKRLDYMETRSDVMVNKISDMDKSQGLMDRLVSGTSESIVILTDQLEEFKIQIEAMQKVEDDLKVQYNDVLVRIRDKQAQHRKFVDDRRSKLRQLEEEKQKSIKLNKELASKYRSSQNNQMVLKEKVMNNFENRVKMESEIKDVKELQALQLRMHRAMLEYYKYRGMYNLTKLSCMEHSSQENSDKVTNLQESMNNALKNITEFLQTQMTPESIRNTAWSAMKKEELKIGAKQAISGIEPVITSSTIKVA